MTLPPGVTLTPLSVNPDGRGSVTEFHRDSWRPGLRPVQWNLNRSEAGVLRGVHVHIRHADYLVLIEGRMSLGLHDMRRSSSAFGRGTLVELEGGAPLGVHIPPGVAHGFYFHALSTHLYSLTEYWGADDELGCRWDDPALGIAWPCQAPVLSERDVKAPSLAELLRAVEPSQSLWLERGPFPAV